MEDMIASSKALDQQTLIKAIWYQLYLNVLTLSDITPASGYTLKQDTYNGISTHQWFSWYSVYPTCGKPSNNDWRMWKMALHICQPLMHWTCKDDFWIWYFDPHADRLFKHTDKPASPPLFIICTIFNTSTHNSHSHRHQCRPFIRSSSISTLPPTANPASVHKKTSASICFHLDSFYTSPSELSLPLNNNTSHQSHHTSTINTHIASLKQYLHWTFQHCILPWDNGMALVQAIRDGTAFGISDGSFKDNLAWQPSSYSYMLSTQHYFWRHYYRMW